MQKSVANDEEIGFGNGEVPVEDFDELAFNPSNITLAEGAGHHSPMNVLQSRVIGVLGREDESAEENAVKGPLFGLNREIRPGALDVDEGDNDVGNGNLSSLDDVRDKLGELGVLVGTGDGTSTRRRGGWGTKGEVDDLSGRLYELFCEVRVSYGRVNPMWRAHTNQAPSDLQVEKLKQLGWVLGSRDEGSWMERHFVRYPEADERR